MTRWDTGNMVFILQLTKDNLPRKWVSKRDEPPSEFITRIVRDMERLGANILPYLVEDLVNYTKLKEEALRNENAFRKKT